MKPIRPARIAVSRWTHGRSASRSPPGHSATSRPAASAAVMLSGVPIRTLERPPGRSIGDPGGRSGLLGPEPVDPIPGLLGCAAAHLAL
jgi:hypothetical protein